MSIFEKERWEVWNSTQHPYKHNLAEFSYTSPTLPGVTNIESALDWILAVLYPNSQAAVATVGDLPAAGNTVNDYRVVTDDGDGKAASYRWEQREGEAVASWKKVYDMDWGEATILSDFLNKTQDMYVYRYGLDDKDSSGTTIAGDLAGQVIFGGSSASTNLTLKANAGDGVGAQTGYVQVADNFRPVGDNTWDIGTSSYGFKTLYLGTSALVSTMTISTGSIVDSTGAITFDDENLVTTGTLGCGVLTAATGSAIGTLTLADGSITDSGGAISFGDENLTTTGTLGCGILTVTDNAQTLIFDPDNAGSIAEITASRGTITFDDENLVTTGTLGAGAITGTQLNIDNLTLDGNTLSSTDTNGNIIIVADGVGVIDAQSALTTVNITTTGTIDVTGQLDVDNLRLDGNTLSSTDTDGNVVIDPNGAGLIEAGSVAYPATTNSFTLGKSGNNWSSLYIDSAASVTDGTTAILVSELHALRNTLFRAADRLTAVQDGDALFYDSASGTWLANHPDTEITHSELTGLTTTDAGHTQFVMLAGRAGGQAIQGGTAASELLTLESTSHSTKGTIQVKDSLLPFTTAAYSAGWTGTDLGGGSNYYNDVYTRGEFKNLRLENLTVATLNTFSAQNVGRLTYATDNGKVYVDTGTEVKVVSATKYIEDTSWNGTDLSKAVTITGMVDARNAIWQLKDNTNDYEVLGVQITSTGVANVTITTEIALPAGSYRLIGIEV